MTIKEISNFLESLAPLAYQESYDNCGLIIGNATDEVTNLLVTLDVTEEVLKEAIDKGCNLIVAHHPLIFKGLKKINGNNYVEKCVIMAIQNKIAIYAIHTNLDNVAGGVNFRIAEKLNLKGIKILSPKNDNLISKLTVFIPKEKTGDLLDSLYKAGAGEIGAYANCSFRSEGKGTFKPKENANPWLGTVGRYEEVAENKVEVVFPSFKKSAILAAMRSGHVYEEISYYLETLENINQEVGSGAIGVLENPMEIIDFLPYLKEKMNLDAIRYTATDTNIIKKIAVCGGVGSFLLGAAKSLEADVFITSDYKYHEFFDAENEIMIADIGHYESEQFTKDLLVEKISKKFTNFATYLSDINTNPIKYYS